MLVIKQSQLLPHANYSLILLVLNTSKSNIPLNSGIGSENNQLLSDHDTVSSREDVFHAFDLPISLYVYLGSYLYLSQELCLFFAETCENFLQEATN